MSKVLIIGGGLAGCTLAIQFIQQGHTVSVVDSGTNHSSTVAAGMINPLVFRRMTRSWRLDEFLEYGYPFYQQLEKLTSSRFFHPIIIRRFFSSQQERGFWEEKSVKEQFINYMHPIVPEDETYMPYANQYGSGRVKQAAYIQTTQFLSSCKTYISTNGKWHTEVIDYSSIDPINSTWKNEVFDYIIFCEGYLGKENPWFGHLPLNQTKGETLTVELANLPENESLNRKCFMLPIGNHQFKVGATYVWNTNTLNITEEGKEHLLANLNYLTDEIPKVISQNAGVRPTTVDRRPLMGQHPEFNKLYVFNGLGTKGYMMAPLLSKELASFITHGTPLNTECSITRFR